MFVVIYLGTELMTYWETQLPMPLIFREGKKKKKKLFKVPAGYSRTDSKKFYSNKSIFTDTFSMYHLLATIKTIPLMAYLWITQLLGIPVPFCLMTFFWLLNPKSVYESSGPKTGSGNHGPWAPNAAMGRFCWGQPSSSMQRVAKALGRLAEKEETYGIQWLGERPGWRGFYNCIYWKRPLLQAKC